MTTNTARRILLYTVVMWDNDPHDLGTVTAINSNGFHVAWANGQSGWIDFQDAAQVSIR